jgi:hypothetical protein
VLRGEGAQEGVRLGEGGEVPGGGVAEEGFCLRSN